MNTAPQASERAVPESLRALLENLIDYAGLFPPAALDMSTAVRNYAGYLGSKHSWMLGRFVAPVARLSEFEQAQASLPVHQEWKVSALLGTEFAADIQRIAGFNLRNTDRARIDSVEAKVGDSADVRRIATLLPADTTAYFEISPDRAFELIPVIRAAGARAKIRTGGLTPDAIPGAESVAAFLAECARANVAFKATAGLHHPLRCEKPLTYEADAPQANMHGFLNVFLAATAIYGHHDIAPEHRASIHLTASSPELEFTNDAVTVRIYQDRSPQAQETEETIRPALTRIPTAHIRRARRDFAISFGSCSFEEPISDLQELNLL